MRARVNESTVTVSQTIAFADGSGDVVLDFKASSNEVAVGSTPFVSVTAVDAAAYAGQSFTADLAFTKTATGLTVAATNVALVLRDGTTDVLSLTGSGQLRLGASGASALIEGDVTLLVPGVSLSTDLRLLVNTTTDTPSFTLSGGGSITLPAGPYLRLSATGVTLVVAGQSITGLAVDVERAVVDGAAVTRVTVSGGTIELSTGATVVVRLTGVNGALVLGARGLAGRIAATVALNVPGVTGGTVSVAVNTSDVAALGLPAGPYLRLEIVGASLTVAGQTLGADLAVERATDDGGQPVVVVALTHLTLAVTAGGQPVVASITDGSGVLVATTAGVAARVTGTVTVSIPGVSLTGTLDLRFNGTTSDVNRVVTLGGSQVSIVLPAAATTAGYLRVQGTGIVITVAGQRLAGDVVIERSGATTQLDVTGASLELGGGLASVTGASAHLTVEAAGVHGTFTGAIAFSVPSVSLAATVTVDLDTRAATLHVRVQATGVDLVLAGQSLHGDVVVEQTTSATGQTVVTVAAVVNTLADPTDLLTLKTGATTILTVAAATGVVVIGPGGVAGSLDVQSFTLSLGGGITLTADRVTVEVNTGRTAASHTVTVGGTTVALSLPAGPFVSVALLGAKLTLGASGPVLAGSFALRQGTAGDGSAITVIAATDVSVDVTVGGDGARLVDGEGAFVILTNGVAGYLTGKVTIAAGPVGAGADILLRVNTTPGAVDTSVDVGGRTLSVKFTSGNVFSVSLSNLSLTIADFVTIEGSVGFSDTTIGGQAAQVFAGDGLTIFLGRGPAKLDTGETNPLATGILLTNGRIGLIRIGSTWALTASGTVSIIGVAGVTLTGTVAARVNTTGLVIDQSLEMPGWRAAGRRHVHDGGTGARAGGHGRDAGLRRPVADRQLLLRQARGRRARHRERSDRLPRQHGLGHPGHRRPARHPLRHRGHPQRPDLGHRARHRHRRRPEGERQLHRRRRLDQRRRRRQHARARPARRPVPVGRGHRPHRHRPGPGRAPTS